MPERVAITGLGLVTPLGETVPETWTALLSGKRAAKAWEDLKSEDFRHTVACRIPSNSPNPGRDMALTATAEALSQAGLTPPQNTGVFLGSTMGESSHFEEAARTGNASTLENSTAAAFPKAIAKSYALKGPQRAYGTACAAGNYAIRGGADALLSGRCDVAITGGVEPFSRIAMAGFSRSRAMSSKGACLPFQKNRDGMLLGEGAAILILEREKDARARGAAILAIVGALGITSDAYHPTAPDPEATHAIRAITQALDAQNITPADIDLISAHGTGTTLSDASEAKAIEAVFATPSPCVTGLKSSFGHALGAASAIEAALLVKGIYEGIIPPTNGAGEPEFPISLITEPIAKPLGWVANLAFAFGGLNTCLLLGKP